MIPQIGDGCVACGLCVAVCPEKKNPYRIFMNYEIIQEKWMPSREDREYKEEILEGVDDAVSTLERMISEERVEELLSTLTDLQRKVVHIHLFHTRV